MTFIKNAARVGVAFWAVMLLSAQIFAPAFAADTPSEFDAQQQRLQQERARQLQQLNQPPIATSSTTSGQTPAPTELYPSESPCFEIWQVALEGGQAPQPNTSNTPNTGNTAHASRHHAAAATTASGEVSVVAVTGRLLAQQAGPHGGTMGLLGVSSGGFNGANAGHYTFDGQVNQTEIAVVGRYGEVRPGFKAGLLVGEEVVRYAFALQTLSQGADKVLGRCIGVQGMNVALKRVQTALIKKGFVTARVLVPPQNLSSGTLRLVVMEGRIGQVRYAESEPDASLAAPAGTRRCVGTQHPPFALAGGVICEDVGYWARYPYRGSVWNALPRGADAASGAATNGVGTILNLRDIEQAVENMKRVPSADADIQIVPAHSEPGVSDLVVSYSPTGKADGSSTGLLQKLITVPLRLNMSVDDSGSASTGKYQGSVTLNWDNPLSLNDLFYLSYNHDLLGRDQVNYQHKDGGTNGYALHYSVPYGYWLLSVNRSQSEYFQAVAGAATTYIYSGNSANSDVKLSRVLYRDAKHKTTVGVKAFVRQSRNYVDDTEVEVQRRRTAGWEASVAHKTFIGEGSIEGCVNYKRGTGAFDALRAPEELFDEGTSRMQIVTADASFSMPFKVAVYAARAPSVPNKPLYQAIVQDSAQAVDAAAVLREDKWRYGLSMRGQWNCTPLTSQDQFGIGGRYTVRGFDGRRSLAAERGVLIKQDVDYTLPSTEQNLYWGLDYGHVSGANVQNLLGQSLWGTALGLRGGKKLGGVSVGYDVFVGVPVVQPQGFGSAKVSSGFTVNVGL